MYTDDAGNDVQPLAAMYETAFAFADSLTDDQFAALYQSEQSQGLADDETTGTALAAIEATLDDTYVNWSGATVYEMSEGEGIFYRISGPNVFIEFASQQGSAGADVDGFITAGWGHIHTLYRDRRTTMRAV